MTAQVDFIKENRQNVLTVPIAALRFQPSSLTEREIQDMILAAGIADLPSDQREAARESIESAKAATSPDGKGTQTRGLAGMMMPMGPPIARSSANSLAALGSSETQSKKTLWYLVGNGKLAVRLVKVGASSGTHTEIIGADDLEGKAIIVRTKVE